MGNDIGLVQNPLSFFNFSAREGLVFHASEHYVLPSSSGTYTSQSDVWSFGVVLWELFTLGYKPYPGLTNVQILDFLETGRRMNSPLDCPRQIYSVMLKCWNMSSNDRPTFIQLPEMFEEIRTQVFAPGEDYYTSEVGFCNDVNDVIDDEDACLEEDDTIQQIVINKLAKCDSASMVNYGKAVSQDSQVSQVSQVSQDAQVDRNNSNEEFTAPMNDVVFHQECRGLSEENEVEKCDDPTVSCDM